MAKLEPVSDDYRYLRADGSLAWLKIHWYPIATADGKLSHIQGFGSDISEAVYQARRTRHSSPPCSARPRLSSSIWTERWSRPMSSFSRPWAISLGELKGKHHSLFCTPEDAASADYKAFWQKLNRGEYVADRFKRSTAMAARFGWKRPTTRCTTPKATSGSQVANVVTDQVMREGSAASRGVAYDISLQTDVSAERGASVVKDTR